ncbi:hypothetical protein H4K35_02010 [Myroides sp. NP-2]|uniref:hypothetical protein n=1 Tax=Myroides sp. NP-2 TaxID=2759945 RepID=UPI0015FD07F7|nr:hypothetical protein [Myroides sp. NP-2]MBB1148913.1 hypothetical protein [Myroides sp. NP-2]
MSTKPHTQVRSTDQYNLVLLEELVDLHTNFTSYAQSINELFYYYVQHCTDKGEDLFLDTSDVHRILQVVTLLQRLKEPVQ